MIGEKLLNLIKDCSDDTEIILQVLFTPRNGYLKCQYIPMNIAFLSDAKNRENTLTVISNASSNIIRDLLWNGFLGDISGSGYEGALTCGDIRSSIENDVCINNNTDIIIMIVSMYLKEDRFCYDTALYVIHSIAKIGNRIVIKCDMDPNKDKKEK